jgi:hypothetical protein
LLEPGPRWEGFAMPFLLTILALDAIFVAHAAMTGRPHGWVGAILALPMIGAFAYVAVEMIPEYTEARLLDQGHQGADTADCEKSGQRPISSFRRNFVSPTRRG